MPQFAPRFFRSCVGLGLRGGALCAAVALAGCYEDLNEQPPAAKQPAPVADDPVDTLTSTSNSALGGAKQSAENLRARVETQQRELGKMADEQSNPDGDTDDGDE